MDKNFAFTKTNYILIAIGFLIVLAGFVLMSGGATTEEAFNPDIFSDRRIKLAPMVCLAGFLFVIAAILWPAGDGKQQEKAEPLKEVANE